MTLRTITVGELIERLKGEDPDALVIFTADYGDRCHTAQALPIRGRVETVTIRESGYSSSGYAVVDDGDDSRDDSDDYLVIW